MYLIFFRFIYSYSLHIYIIFYTFLESSSYLIAVEIGETRKAEGGYIPPA